MLEGHGQRQTVPSDALEKKVGHKLNLGEVFETSTGFWKVVYIGKDGTDTYTVEMIA